MHDQRTWRGLAVTYAVAAIVQLYLALSMGATWAGVLAVLWLLAALGSGVIALRQGHHDQDEDADLDELTEGGLRLDDEELVQWAARRAGDRTL
ncbi:hypothetical protein ACIA2T_04600 [Amycolatopsis japonica]|uniref:hypothetical protein n=1 Tax=Amycolatopsis japonica TaxID=208439 RepID=UPI0037A06664